MDRREFRARMAEQREVNEAMFKENILARWLWNAEGTKAGLVPWTLQVVNTRP